MESGASYPLGKHLSTPHFVSYSVSFSHLLISTLMPLSNAVVEKAQQNTQQSVLLFPCLQEQHLCLEPLFSEQACLTSCWEATGIHVGLQSRNRKLSGISAHWAPAQLSVHINYIKNPHNIPRSPRWLSLLQAQRGGKDISTAMQILKQDSHFHLC